MMDGKLYWKCEDCDFTTTAKRNAALHYRTIHLGVYKYQCTICGKGFQERNRVRSHMMAQHGLEKIYKCHLCPTTFTLKASLVRHLKGHGQAPLNLKKTSTEDISTKLGSEKQFIQSPRKLTARVIALFLASGYLILHKFVKKYLIK